MAKGIMVVQTNPRDSACEDEFNDWYTNTHVPELCAVPGFVGARRYKVHPAGVDDTPPPTHAYLAVYEIEADDLVAPMRDYRARAAAGLTTRSDTVRTDPPTVVTFYELLD